jgi:hypothetical protein
VRAADDVRGARHGIGQSSLRSSRIAPTISPTSTPEAVRPARDDFHQGAWASDAISFLLWNWLRGAPRPDSGAAAHADCTLRRRCLCLPGAVVGTDSVPKSAFAAKRGWLDELLNQHSAIGLDHAL